MRLLELREKSPREIVSEVLDLNQLEKEIYFSMLDSKYTVKDLVEETGRSRSVVQRALQSLMEKELVVRKGITDRTVYYVYESLPFEKVKQMVVDTFEDWFKQVRKRLSS